MTDSDNVSKQKKTQHSVNPDDYDWSGHREMKFCLWCESEVEAVQKDSEWYCPFCKRRCAKDAE